MLYAVAAAVIGGTSLFGGRGKMMDALLGGLVVGVIYNGLQLLGPGAAAQLIWTALVLVAAVTMDALTRRGRGTTLSAGRAPADGARQAGRRPLRACSRRTLLDARPVTRGIRFMAHWLPEVSVLRGR